MARILVVDDERTTLEALQTILRREEHVVLTAASAQEVETQLQALAGEGYGHLVVVGLPAADALAALADRRRDLTFSIVDFSFDPALPNAQGLIFRDDEAGYLAGALAGLMSESRVVGSRLYEPLDHNSSEF